MNAQSLAWSASSSRAARSSAPGARSRPRRPPRCAAPPRRAPKASSATAGAVPRGQVLARAPAGRRELGRSHRLGPRSSPSETVTSASPWRRPRRARPPATAGPSYHQCPSSSVSSAQQSRPPPLAARSRRARRRSRARARAASAQRGLVVVGRGRRCPRAAGRGPCGGGSRGRCRGPGSRRRSCQTSSTVCQSIGTATGPAEWRHAARAAPAAPSPCAVGLVHAERAATPASASARSRPGAYAHSGSQKPPPQPPKRRWCDAMPVRSCRSHARRRWPAAAGPRGWPPRSTARPVAERRRRRAGRGRARSKRCAGRARSRPRRGAPRRPARLAAALAGRPRPRRARRPHLAQEGAGSGRRRRRASPRAGRTAPG